MELVGYYVLELGNFGVEVGGELSFWCEACSGEGCADLFRLWSGGEFGSKFCRYGNVFDGGGVPVPLCGPQVLLAAFLHM